jgi:hypothetical protein
MAPDAMMQPHNAPVGLPSQDPPHCLRTASFATVGSPFPHYPAAVSSDHLSISMPPQANSKSLWRVYRGNSPEHSRRPC